MLRLLRLILPMLWLLEGAATAQHRVSFPGAEESAAPSGPFTLRYVKPASNSEEYEVHLVNGSNRNHCWSYKFMRRLDALWSPDGKALAVTDWTGSNVADVVVLLPEEKCRRVSIPEELFRSLGEQPFLKDSNHSYFEALSWRTPTVLEFRVWGDRGSTVHEDFDERFEYQLGGKVQRSEAAKPAAEANR
jgi:hypothetical protein